MLHLNNLECPLCFLIIFLNSILFFQFHGCLVGIGYCSMKYCRGALKVSLKGSNPPTNDQGILQFNSLVACWLRHECSNSQLCNESIMHKVKILLNALISWIFLPSIGFPLWSSCSMLDGYMMTIIMGIHTRN